MEKSITLLSVCLLSAWLPAWAAVRILQSAVASDRMEETLKAAREIKEQNYRPGQKTALNLDAERSRRRGERLQLMICAGKGKSFTNRKSSIPTHRAMLTACLGDRRGVTFSQVMIPA